MISKTMVQAMNRQLNAEMYSSYLYLSMAAWFEGQNLRGMAQWMRVQAKEEHAHGMKFYEYIVDRCGTVALDAIEAPPAKWASPLAVFEATLQHERKITGLIDALAGLAEKETDRAASVFLQWFITEQVEEEANAAQIVETLRKIKDSVGGLFHLDHHLGKRE